MSPVKEPAAAQIAEAAAWVAHLHGTKRTADSDRGLRLWLKEDTSRERVWEVATEVWEEVGNLQGAVIAKAIPSVSRHARRAAHGARFIAVAASLAVLVVGAIIWTRLSGVSTGVGEQRTVALDDGTRVILNTATRIVVSYDKHVRKVELKSGEARFDVAKLRDRPFIAVAGNRQVEAIGTSFVVRYEPDRTSITLVEGTVAVSPVSPRPYAGEEKGRRIPQPSSAVVTLAPGQRLTFTTDVAPQLDAPQLEKVIAWQRGEVVMDGMRLKDAVAEMNRYSSRKLAVEDPQAVNLVVSGVFQSGDSLSFANAVAHTYQLRVFEDDGRIALTGDPKAAYR